MKCLILSEKDYLLYKEIRLKALQSDPIYFGSTYEEEAMKSDDYFKSKVKFSYKHFVMGFYDGTKLINVAVFKRQTELKEAHKGEITSIVCLKEYRNQGLTYSLLSLLIRKAFTIPSLKIIKLTCLAENNNAQNLYRKLGFRCYGEEPNSLFDGDKYYNENLWYLDYHSFNTR
ncbi:GNAT family N-acetyltransferase [Leuconostoc pseudomesenteroides]|uniref:GNAT family N-acetyltransferase n=1 Tax=Leuconostoc pseudomesenteroides TaxID=33968 RepID=UPI0039E72DF3